MLHLKNASIFFSCLNEKNYVSSCQFSPNVAPFLPARTPNGHYSGAWAILGMHFLITLLIGTMLIRVLRGVPNDR
jgi:hypothetical protein